MQDIHSKYVPCPMYILQPTNKSVHMYYVVQYRTCKKCLNGLLCHAGGLLQVLGQQQEAFPAYLQERCLELTGKCCVRVWSNVQFIFWAPGSRFATTWASFVCKARANTFATKQIEMIITMRLCVRLALLIPKLFLFRILDITDYGGKFCPPP